MNIKISPREKEVLDLISLGYTDKEISSQLYLSPYTVTDHRYSLISKLNGKNAASLIRKAFELGFLPIAKAQ